MVRRPADERTADSPVFEKQKAAGAVRVLGLARAEAGLADERRLLVAEDAGDRHTRDRLGARQAIPLAARPDQGQHPAGDLECGEQLRIPVQRVQVHQLRPARVGHVGNVKTTVGTARQVPHQERVDVAEQCVSALGQLARLANVVEDPADLQAAEVAGKRQARARPEELDTRPLDVTRQVLRDARVLPDECVTQRLARTPIPHDCRFALVRDADSGQVARFQPARPKGTGDHRLRVAPDLGRVVLHPAGLRIDLSHARAETRRRCVWTRRR